MIYEFICKKHGVFEAYRNMDNCTASEPCPVCKRLSERIISLPTVKIVQDKKRLPLGSGSEGKIVSSKETGGLDIFIPSYGMLEQEEVDYIAEGAVEKEKARVRKKKKIAQRANQAMVQSFVDLANKTPRGQKAKAIREAMKDTARQV
jgi:putative FmdB family regulatory protein